MTQDITPPQGHAPLFPRAMCFQPAVNSVGHIYWEVHRLAFLLPPRRDQVESSNSLPFHPWPPRCRCVQKSTTSEWMYAWQQQAGASKTNRKQNPTHCRSVRLTDTIADSRPSCAFFLRASRNPPAARYVALALFLCVGTVLIRTAKAPHRAQRHLQGPHQRHQEGA